MRLIDADALPNELFKKHVHDGEELVPMLYYDDAVKVVEYAPTIDAIPVDWLEKMAEQHKSALFNAYWFVLKTWRNEQEAR